MIKKTQPVSCLGKAVFYNEDEAWEKSHRVSKKFKCKYSVYKCQWCTKANLQDTYHLATVKKKTTKKNYSEYLKYYEKPVVVPPVRSSFIVRLGRACKHAYRSFIFHIK